MKASVEKLSSLAGGPFSSADQKDKGHDQAEEPPRARQLEKGEQQSHTP